MKLFITITLILVHITGVLKAQNRVSCIVGDTLRLQVDDYRGNASWEESNDSLNWVEISGSTAELSIIATTGAKWVRAKIEEDNCPNYYESSFKIQAIDTSVIGFSRSHLALENVVGILLSQNGSNEFVFDMEGAHFPLSAGDYLKGLEGQQAMLLIDLIIEYQGITTVYASQTTISVYSLPTYVGSEANGNVTQAEVVGRVFNEQGDPVVGALVKIGNDELFTDTNGVFRFENAQFVEMTGYLTATKEGYFEGSRTFIAKESSNYIKIHLLSKNSAAIFASSSGGSFETENVTIEFPANAISLNGNEYNGNVNLNVNYINPDSDNFDAEMPGRLFANQFGNLRGLNSFGIIAINMVDDSGNELQLSDGQTVTVHFPISATMQSFASDTIDLWSFNEEFGIWQNEGVALKNGDTYTAELPHFSFWNISDPFELIYLSGTILDDFGNPYPPVNVTIAISSSGASYTDLSNDQGFFSGLVPANMYLDIIYEFDCGSQMEYVGGVWNQTITQDTSFTQTLFFAGTRVHGRVENCYGEALENGYILNSNKITYLNDGDFTLYICGLSTNTDSLKVYQTSPSSGGEWQYFNNQWVEMEFTLPTFIHCDGSHLVTGTVNDIDGNTYNTVLIAGSWYMSENLKTTRFSDGSLIPNITDSASWVSLSTGAWCNYENLPVNDDIYGKLYNWYAVSDPRNVCPTGWHVPSYEEWVSLTDSLGGEGNYFGAGGKMKSISGWNSPNSAANNVSGFSGLPGGIRTVANFQEIGTHGRWFSSTSASEFDSWFLYLENSNIDVLHLITENINGLSVRCTMD